MGTQKQFFSSDAPVLKKPSQKAELIQRKRLPASNDTEWFQKSRSITTAHNSNSPNPSKNVTTVLLPRFPAFLLKWSFSMETCPAPKFKLIFCRKQLSYITAYVPYHTGNTQTCAYNSFRKKITAPPPIFYIAIKRSSVLLLSRVFIFLPPFLSQFPIICRSPKYFFLHISITRAECFVKANS